MIQLDLHTTLKSAEGDFELKARMEIHQGDFVCIQGPSGAGKTSFLKMISGLLNPDAGRITVKDKPWFDSENKINIDPQKRKVGFVFQQYNLFPNMSVIDNIKFGIKSRQEEYVNDLIKVLQVEGLESRMPQSLSGGQQQRVALARTIAYQPTVLLLDEPFSALDTEMRMELRQEVLKLHGRFELTTVMVTHDEQEAQMMANRIFRIEDGVLHETEGHQKMLRLEGKLIGIENNMAQISIGTKRIEVPVECLSDPDKPFIGQKVEFNIGQ